MTGVAGVPDLSTHDYCFFKATRPEMEYVERYIQQLHSNGWEVVQVMLSGYQRPIVLARRSRSLLANKTPEARKPLLDWEGNPLVLGARYLYCAGCRGLIRDVRPEPHATLCDACRNYSITCKFKHCCTCAQGKEDA